MLLALTLIACSSEPAKQPAAGPPASQPPGEAPPAAAPGAGVPPAGDPASGALPVGDATPPSATPGAGTPADPSAAGGMTPPAPSDAATPAPTGGEAAPSAMAEPGKGVLVKGTLAYAGSKKGKLTIDLMQGGDNGPGQMIAQLTPSAPGPFQFEVKPGLGKFGVFAYIDVAGDGLSPDDPAGGPEGVLSVANSEVQIGTITIKDR